MKKDTSQPVYNNKIIAWIDERLPVFSLMDREYGRFPTPRNFNYLWNFGAMAMFMLVLMIVTGIVLAMHYVPSTTEAFDKVERITRDVNYGWLLRYLHMNGASFFFIVVYIHMFRGLYYGSYKKPRELLWILGVVIFLLMMATAFMGYVLPWGQMSFWGATVITNLFTAIPIAGDDILRWISGGYSIDYPTLNRFFPLHYLFPFLIVGVVALHVAALHITGSNNPTGIDPKGPQDTVPFHPFYTMKDVFGLMVMLFVFFIFVFYIPDYLGHPDNYTPADPLKTPPHIVPEWYFLPFYAILRSIPNEVFGIVIPGKEIGVLLMFSSIFVLFFLPWLDRSSVRSARYRPVYRWMFWLFVVDALVLGYVGAKSPEGMWLPIARFATAYYFLHFLVFIPLLSKFEKTKPMPASIFDAVISGVSEGSKKKINPHASKTTDIE